VETALEKRRGQSLGLLCLTLIAGDLSPAYQSCPVTKLMDRFVLSHNLKSEMWGIGEKGVYK